MQYSNNIIACPDCGEPLVLDATDPEYSYRLIDGYLVPRLFLEFLEEYFQDDFIPDDAVLSPRTLFHEVTWNAFDDDERKVALACVLYLIDSGAVKTSPPEKIRSLKAGEK